MSQWWEVSGRLEVEERATTGCVRRRPLDGVSIDIAGWPDERACFSLWGSTHTDHAGRFRLRVNRPVWAHRLRIDASFVGDKLVVCDDTSRGVVGRRPVTIHESDEPVDGPFVDAGTITIRDGATGDLGSPGTVRRAISWYAARSAMDYLASLGDGLRLTRRIAVVCPAITAEASSGDVVDMTGSLTCEARLGPWSVEMVVRQVMRHWARQCVASRINWPRYRLNMPVDAQFAELAKDELMRALWGRPSGRARAV